MKPNGNSYAEVISATLDVLRKGGIILYPTDTVWGIGCDATNPEAVARVYEIKRRADSKALVLLADSLDRVCRYVKEIPDMAIQLVEVNDSPMTIIYPGAIAGKAPEEGQKAVADRHFLAYNAVAEDGTVAIRIPDMQFCKDVIFKLGRPIVSTSANISGEPSPVKFADVAQEVRDAVDYIVKPSLEAGSTGKASQIIKVDLDGGVKIIRA